MQLSLEQTVGIGHKLRAGIRALAMAAGMLLGASHAEAVTIDFETLPLLPTQPDNFFAAGPAQTYSAPGLYSISGGVVLGNPSFLPAFATHGSGTNLYGTADFGDASLLDTITLLLPEAAAITSVSGVLFNGQSVLETYTVDFFSGSTLLFEQVFTDLAANIDVNAYRNFAYASTLVSPITSVTITTPNADINGWDFFVDSIVLESADHHAPEPSNVLLLAAGLAMLAAMLRARRRA